MILLITSTGDIGSGQVTQAKSLLLVPTLMTALMTDMHVVSLNLEVNSVEVIASPWMDGAQLKQLTLMVMLLDGQLAGNHGIFQTPEILSMSHALVMTTTMLGGGQLVRNTRMMVLVIHQEKTGLKPMSAQPSHGMVHPVSKPGAVQHQENSVLTISGHILVATHLPTVKQKVVKSQVLMMILSSNMISSAVPNNSLLLPLLPSPSSPPSEPEKWCLKPLQSRL